MARKQIKKTVGKCQVVVTEFDGRVTMTCKNLKRKPTSREVEKSAQSILDSILNHKVIFK